MLSDNFKNKKVLITGNTGFKGSWLTCWLNNMGAKIYGISNGIPTKPSMFESLELIKKINHYNVDIRNYKSTFNVINKIKPDFVFHLAAQPLVITSYLDPLNTISTNVNGTTNILEALRIINHNCVAIIITSDKCYDNVEWVWGYKETDNLGGKDIYSGSKGAVELIFKSYYNSYFKDSENYNIRTATVRAGNVIGGGDWANHRIIPDCIRAWVKGESVEIRSPDATRPWQHVLEPLSGYLTLANDLLLDNKLNGQNFNFGPREEHKITVKELLEDFSKYWNLKQEPSFISKNVSTFYESSLLKLNCDKALFDLKWLPTLEYNKLIEFTSLWYYKYYMSNNDMLSFTNNQINEYESIAKKNNIIWSM